MRDSVARRTTRRRRRPCWSRCRSRRPTARRMRTAAALRDGVAAAAGFRGGNLATPEDDSPHRVAVDAGAELYVGHADNDRWMPPEQMARLTRALAEAHVRHTAELYVGAGHGW